MRRKICYGILFAYIFVMLLICARFTTVLYGHDFSFHAQRIDAIAQELQNGGELPVRIYHSTLGGLGYPSPLFYGDIFLYPAALLVSCNLVSVIQATKITIWAVMLGAGISFYASLRILRAGKEAAFVSAVFYMFSPYCLTDFFVRAAVGEALGLVFAPLAVAAFYRILHGDTRRRYVLLLSLSMAALLLSHLLTTVIVAVLLLFWVIVHYCRAFLREHRADFSPLLRLLWAACICVGVTAWFIFPMLEQIYRTPDLAAFSGSGYSPEEWIVSAANHFITYDGLCVLLRYPSLPVHFLLKTVSMEVTVGTYLYPLLAAALAFVLERKHLNRRKAAAGLLLFCAVIIAAMSTKFIWHLKILHPIQFPWRLLVLYTAAMGILCALYLGQKHLSAITKSIVCLGFAAASLIFCVPTLMVTRDVTKPQQSYGSFSVGLCDYLRLGCHYGDLEEKCVIVNDPDSNYTLEKSPNSLAVSFIQSQGETVELPLIYVYGYTAHDKNGTQEYEVSCSPGGYVQVRLPENGTGTMIVAYTGTTVQRISEWISAISLLLILLDGVVILARKHQPTAIARKSNAK